MQVNSNLRQLFNYPSIPPAFFKIDDWLNVRLVLFMLIALIAPPIIIYNTGFSWAWYAIAFVVSGVAGEALFILQHDAMHKTLFKSRRLNDTAGGIVSGLIGTRLNDGTHIHLQHHKNIGFDHDPNLYWYDTEKNRPGLSIAIFIFGQLVGLKLIMFGIRTLQVMAKALRGGSMQDGPQPTETPSNVNFSQSRADLFYLLGCQLAVLALFSALTHPVLYLTNYLAPLILLTSFLEAIRAFSEHVIPPGREELSFAEQRRMYFVDANRAELWAMSQFGFHYHHLHHAWPNISVSKLPSLHKYLTQHDADYSNKFVVRGSYLGTLRRYMLGKKFT